MSVRRIWLLAQLGHYREEVERIEAYLALLKADDFWFHVEGVRSRELVILDNMAMLATSREAVAAYEAEIAKGDGRQRTDDEADHVS